MDKKLVKEYTDTTVAIQVVEHKMSLAVAGMRNELTTLKEREEQMRGLIKDSMEKNVITKFENDVLRITYIAPQTRNTIDVTRLKEEKPDIAKEYMKQSSVNSSIRIKVKEII